MIMGCFNRVNRLLIGKSNIIPLQPRNLPLAIQFIILLGIFGLLQALLHSRQLVKSCSKIHFYALLVGKWYWLLRAHTTNRILLFRKLNQFHVLAAYF